MSTASPNQWHTIVRCKYCRERFGTAAALELHKPAPAPKRSRQLKQTGTVRRSFCASEKTMIRGGAWRGYGGVWWTVEVVENDANTGPTETIAIHGPQAAESKVVILDKNGNPTSAIAQNQKPHNHGPFSVSVSKLRRGTK